MTSRVCILALCAVGTDAFRARHKAKEASGLPRVLTPSDGDQYVQALSSTNRFCPVRCASQIVQPASTEELAAWLMANNDTKFTVKGGGHSYSCQSVPKDGGVLIHTERLNNAEVFRRSDGSAYARVGAGLTFDQVIPRLAKLNYSMPHGECLTVGVGGWTLNIGNHPELKNFGNKWGYDGKAWLKKATFVTYAGSIFTIDENGADLVKLGAESWLGWHNRNILTRLKAEAMSLFTPDLAASGPMMRAFKIFGASLAIATEFEFELVPKPEPAFIQVVYGINDILEESGKGQALMRAIVDVVHQAGPDDDLDCGIFYATDYTKGTKESVVALKCADWASTTGETVRRWAPAGFREFKPKKSGFLTWNMNSYGKGWVPMWHAEEFSTFAAIGGADMYRNYLRTLEDGDSQGPNPCDSCLSELMYLLEPLTSPHMMFDSFCSGTSANQEACSAFAVRAKTAFMADRQMMQKQNLPSCTANGNWKSSTGEYAGGGWELANALKWTWDPEKKVDFWLGVGHEGNGDECEALRVQAAGATCQAHGITALDLEQAEISKVRSKCPTYESYTDYDSQNNGCGEYIYESATPLPVTDV